VRPLFTRVSDEFPRPCDWNTPWTLLAHPRVEIDEPHVQFLLWALTERDGNYAFEVALLPTSESGGVNGRPGQPLPVVTSDGGLHEHQAILVKTSYFALAQQMEASKHTIIWMLTQNANLEPHSGAGGGMKRFPDGIATLHPDLSPEAPLRHWADPQNEFNRGGGGSNDHSASKLKKIPSSSRSGGRSGGGLPVEDEDDEEDEDEADEEEDDEEEEDAVAGGKGAAAFKVAQQAAALSNRKRDAAAEAASKATKRQGESGRRRRRRRRRSQVPALASSADEEDEEEQIEGESGDEGDVSSSTPAPDLASPRESGVYGGGMGGGMFGTMGGGVGGGMGGMDGQMSPAVAEMMKDPDLVAGMINPKVCALSYTRCLYFSYSLFLTL
jgi:hypothetical protein